MEEVLAASRAADPLYAHRRVARQERKNCCVLVCCSSM